MAPRLAEAQAGQRAVLFVDAAHGVCALFVGMVWCVARLCVKAPAGRPRLHGLAAWPAITPAVWTVKHLTAMTAEPGGAWLALVAGTYPDRPSTILVDNARYQRGLRVPTVAQT